MKKDNKIRLVAVFSIFLSIVGLTLGFAAFSNTLTISSSATVSPDASDFKLVLYGAPQIIQSDGFDYDDPEIVSLFTSKTAIAPLLGNFESASIGVIDNDNLVLKNLTAEFENPDDDPVIDYLFLLKNEGQYDAYANMANFKLPDHTCFAADGTTPALVQEACKGMSFNIGLGFIDKSTSKIDWDISKKLDANGNLKLARGEFYFGIIQMSYKYGSTRADGLFTVKWDDLKIEFSTAKI